MKRHLRYLSYVLRHKWFVFLFGLALHVPIWRLLLHDWTKFLPGEWLSYARTFRKPNGEAQYEPHLAFWQAWNRHEKRHKHHWQYWVLVKDTGELMALPMPDVHRREMLADWRAAGRALGKPDTKAWYIANRDKMQLHPETRAWVERQLAVISDEVREALSDLSHEIWSHWMEYVFSIFPPDADGKVTIIDSYAARWTRQIHTPYAELSESEKESDREQADKIIALLYQHLFEGDNL